MTSARKRNYNNFMITKKKEIDAALKKLSIEKQKNDILQKKDYEKNEIIERLKVKCEGLENDIKIKNSRINHLLDITKHQEENSKK